jgi:hypothetical protein
VKSLKLFSFFLLLLTSTSSIYAASYAPYGSVTEIESKVFKMALKAHQSAVAKGQIAKDQLLTIIDYSKPSTEKRLWVIDTKRMKVLFNTLVAHGRGTGNNMAYYFSDKSGSHQSSLGVFKTGTIYHGNHGRSLNLHGLEKGFNGNAYNRRIVIHGAHYVHEGMKGRLGLSHGCPALSEKEAPEIINKIKGGSLVFAYYPDKTWLDQSRYLN